MSGRIHIIAHGRHHGSYPTVKSRDNLQSWALRWRRAAVIRDSVISVMFLKQ